MISNLTLSATQTTRQDTARWLSAWCPLLEQRRTLDTTNYAMIAQRGEPYAALYRSTGINSLETAPIAGEQGKSPVILGYQAQWPTQGVQYLIIRAKMPVNQWFGFAREDL